MLASVRSRLRTLAVVTLVTALVLAAGAGVPPTSLWQHAAAEAVALDEPPTVVSTTPSDLTTAPSPTDLTPLGDLLLFVADHPAYGRELWSVGADGTGARLVADLREGSVSSFPSDLVAAGGHVFFRGPTPDLGVELWRTDGTSGGTELVADIHVGANSSSVDELTAFGDLVVFQATDGVHGIEPWVSDGTPDGTRMLKDIHPGSTSSGGFYDFTVVGDQVFFTASDPDTGTELWATDGTPGGTRLVADIREGQDGSAPGELTAFRGALFFRADDGDAGNELWTSDGTASGTRRVADIGPGAIGSGIQELMSAGDQLFFRANDGQTGWELWASDGDVAYLVKDIVSGSTGGSVNQITYPQRLTALGDRGIVFVADRQLWVSDGTTAGTTMLAEIRPPDNQLITALPDQLTSIGENVLFAADDGVNGRELWITDGTSGGTRLLADLVPGPAGSFPRFFTQLGDTVFFTAVDAARGFELWSWARPIAPTIDDPIATFDGVELTLAFPGPLQRPDPLTLTRLRVTADGVPVDVLGSGWSPGEPELIVLAIVGGVATDADVRVSYEPRLNDTPIRFADGIEVPPFVDVPASYTRSGWVVASTGTHTEASLDGETWQRSSGPAFGENSNFRVLASDGRGTWLAASRSSSGETANRTAIRRSPDGLTWSEPTAMGIRSLIFAIESVPGGGWLGVGDRFNMLISSADGTTWNVLPDPIAVPVTLSSLAHDGDGRWVAVGEKGTILVSDDRASWDQVGVVGEPDFDRSMRAVAHGGGRWVALADNAVLTSLDGRTWTRAGGPFGTAGTGVGRGVLHDGSGRWLMWTSSNLYTSLDGLDWELAVSERMSVNAAEHHDGQWIIAVSSSPSESCLYVSASATPFEFWRTGCLDGLARSIQHGPLGVDGATIDDEDPIKPSLSLAALEVNQAVQDWNGSVPLVADKATVVRAHFDRIGPPVILSGRLHGDRDGQPLPFSPLSPVNDGGQVEVDGLALESRDDPGRTLNFVLPTGWRTGDVEFRFEPLSLYVVDCDETWVPAGTCTAEATFEPTQEVDLRFVRSGYDIVADGEVIASTPRPVVTDMPEQAFRLMDQIPTPYITSTSTPTMPYTGAAQPTTAEVVEDVRVLRILEGCTGSEACTTHYYGVLGGRGGGRGYRPGRSSMGYTNGTEGRSATGFGRQMIGHEVGHNLDLRHTPMPGPVTNDDSDLVGRCGSTATAGTPVHPYDAEVRPGVFRPTIGPLGDPQSEIWGASPRFFGNDERFAVVDPRETFALMSYCWQGGMQDAWISVDHYLAVFDAFTAGGTVPTEESVTSGSSDGRLLVSGNIDLTDGTTQLRPVWPLLDGAAPEPIVGGDHELRLLDTAGEVLVEQPFGFDEPGPHGDAIGSVRSFFLDLPRPDVPLGRLEIRDPQGALLAVVDAGSGPIDVQVTSPTAGTAIAGDEVSIAWELDAPDDADPVSFVVQHSADDGTTWSTLAVGTTATSLVVPRAELAGSAEARIRVIASADLRTGVGVSERFEIAGNAPVVTIDRPTDGLVVRPTQQVTVVAVAQDAEDGRIRDQQLRWTSSLDGDLGSGEELTVAAGDLRLGSHELTVTATDRDGQVASASVTVQVGIPLDAGSSDGDDPDPDDPSGPADPGGDDGAPQPPPDGDARPSEDAAELPGTPPSEAGSDEAAPPSGVVDSPGTTPSTPTQVRQRALEAAPTDADAGRLPRTGQALLTLLVLATLLFASGTGVLRAGRAPGPDRQARRTGTSG